MESFRRAGQVPVNAFLVDGTYMFKHYFEGEDVFRRLKRYYNNRQYRFEVPPGEFDAVQAFLDEHGYGLVAIDAVAEFVVVVRQYTTHPDNIFERSVGQRRVDDYHCFLMTDLDAVEEAVDDGANRLLETELENPF